MAVEGSCAEFLSFLVHSRQLNYRFTELTRIGVICKYCRFSFQAFMSCERRLNYRSGFFFCSVTSHKKGRQQFKVISDLAESCNFLISGVLLPSRGNLLNFSILFTFGALGVI